MRVLITGGTGMLGSHAAAALSRAGHEVRFLARTPEKVGRVMAPHGLTDLDVVRGDVVDREVVARALDGCDGVVHAAAVITFDLARMDEMFEINVEGTRNVLELAHEKRLDPIVLASSIQALWMPGIGELHADLPVATPEDPYSRTKAEAERIARALQDKSAPVVTLYPSACWGPDNPTVGDQIMTIFAMVEWGYWLCVEGGIPIVDVRDVAQAIVRCMEPDRGPKRYMLAGHYHDHEQLREIIGRVRGRSLLRVPCPGSALRLVGRMGDLVRDQLGIDPGAISAEAMMLATSGLRGDSSAALADLGMTYRPFEETLEAQMRWMYENGHLSRRAAAKLAGP